MGKIFSAYISRDGGLYKPDELRLLFLKNPQLICNYISNTISDYDIVSIIPKEEILNLDLSDKKVGFYPTKIIAKGTKNENDSVILFLYSDFFITAAEFLENVANEMNYTGD